MTETIYIKIYTKRKHVCICRCKWIEPSDEKGMQGKSAFYILNGPHHVVFWEVMKPASCMLWNMTNWNCIHWFDDLASKEN